MNNRPLFFISLSLLLSCFTGCSSVSKMVAGLNDRKKASSVANNPEQMRVATDVALFQPIERIQIPQFQGMQTPLIAGRQRFQTAQRTVNLPRFTAVKVLTRNARFALVELADGQRGYVPRNSIASESSILAAAKAASPVQQMGGPEPILPPQMDASDVPVDQTMLNRIDNIPLPEAEMPGNASPAGSDYSQTADGVMIHKPLPTSETPLPTSVPSAAPDSPEAQPTPPPAPPAAPSLQ